MLVDVGSSNGGSGCWWMWGVSVEVVDVGGCGEFQWRYWVLVDVGSFNGGSGCWLMWGVSMEVLGVGGCGEFQWR